MPQATDDLTPSGRTVEGVAFQATVLKIKALQRFNPRAHDCLWAVCLWPTFKFNNLPGDIQSVLINNGFVDKDGRPTEIVRKIILDGVRDMD